jgi:glycosyltransferase involved in cell wall biosynthesis
VHAARGYRAQVRSLHSIEGGGAAMTSQHTGTRKLDAEPSALDAEPMNARPAALEPQANAWRFDASQADSRPVLSIVVPAHNEEAVIGRNLAHALADAQPGEFEVVVAVNGSTDRTAQVARDSAPGLQPPIVALEIETPSKVAALNAADAEAEVFPRVYLDADVTIDTDALRALALALKDPEQPRVAAPKLDVDASASTWPVRSFYRIWALTDFRQHGHIGSGVYAVSRAGRDRFGEFPDIIADDTFIQQLFAYDERVTLADHSFSVRAPATMRALVRRSARTAAGNTQLKEHFAAGGAGAGNDAGESWGGGSSVKNLLRRVARRPRLWIDFPVYCFGYLAPQYLARKKRRSGRMNVWERDDSSRV